MKKYVTSKKYFWILLSFVMMLAVVGCSSNTTKETADMDVTQTAAETNTQTDTTITILQFSDFHGAVDNATSSKNPGMDKFAAVVKEYTNQTAENNTYIVVSGGDNYQGTAMSNLTHGKVINEMMKALDVTYSAIGNHEYDWGDGYFAEWETDSGMEYLAANVVVKETGEIVDYADPYAIYEANGKKIGFIGIATPDTVNSVLYENIEHLDFLEPVEVVTKYEKILREEEQCDAVIVLSHLPAQQEEDGTITGEAADLANAVDGIDGILSGHSHNYVSGEVNGIPILQPINNGRGLSVLTLTFKGEELSVEYDVRDFVPEVETLSSDEEVKAIYDKYNEELKPILSEVIAEQPMEFVHDSSVADTDLGQYSDKLITEIAGTQIAFTNGGGIRASLEAGELTIGDMYTVFPFDNTIVTMEMTGAHIKEVLEHGLNPDNEVGMIQYYGLIATVDTTKEVGERVVSITLLDGTELDMDGTYTVATNNFLATDGDGFVFSTASNIKDTNKTIRDAMIEHIKELGVVSFEKVNAYIEK